MSNFIIDIINDTNHLLEIETSYNNTINNLDIEISETFQIELINTEKMLPSDLPDNYPMSRITGNLHVTRIDGIDNYLDNYHFDCGTP